MHRETSQNVCIDDLVNHLFSMQCNLLSFKVYFPLVSKFFTALILITFIGYYQKTIIVIPKQLSSSCS